jgi:hypothetical protein
MGRITFDDAVKAVEDDYAMNGRSTLDDVQRQIRLHLKPHFGGQRLTNLTTDVITAYVVARQAEDAENATINRELSTLKRAFRLAKRAGKITSEPHVPMLKERNTRQGFFERAQFEAVVAKLPRVPATAGHLLLLDWLAQSGSARVEDRPSGPTDRRGAARTRYDEESRGPATLLRRTHRATGHPDRADRRNRTPLP